LEGVAICLLAVAGVCFLSLVFFTVSPPNNASQDVLQSQTKVVPYCVLNPGWRLLPVLAGAVFCKTSLAAWFSFAIPKQLSIYLMQKARFCNLTGFGRLNLQSS
jgi:hypothetical protein